MKSAYWVLLVALPAAAQVNVTQHGNDRISVEINGKPFTELFMGPETNKPYLHPLRSASGKMVTRGFPMEKIAGESKDHPHQRGLWFSHGSVNGFDFWANEGKGKKFGRIVLAKVNRLESGKKSGAINVTFNWQDPSGKVLLTEIRRMTFYAQPARRTIDFDITLQAREQVTFGDTKEGTFAVRLAPALEEPHPLAPSEPKRTGTIVDAQGRAGEEHVWGKRAPWIDCSGTIDSEKLGVAIFDHPANPRFPTWWHVRSYGLIAANIFGWHDFDHDSSLDGSLIIPAGEAPHFRYRVVVHSGSVQSGKVAQMYKDYLAGK